LCNRWMIIRFEFHLLTFRWLLSVVSLRTMISLRRLLGSSSRCMDGRSGPVVVARIAEGHCSRSRSIRYLGILVNASSDCILRICVW